MPRPRRGRGGALAFALEGTMQPAPNITGNHTVEGNIIVDNGASGMQGYAATGNVSWNVVAGNGAIQCAGAENAAVKTHAFQGRFEGNLIHGNSELVGPISHYALRMHPCHPNIPCRCRV